jgi:hypothetical protein
VRLDHLLSKEQTPWGNAPYREPALSSLCSFEGTDLEGRFFGSALLFVVTEGVYPSFVDVDIAALTGKDAYALGLWCADGYHRSSSVGLSNVDPILIARFAEYLQEILPPERLRVRVYAASTAMIDQRILDLPAITIRLCTPVKMQRVAYHVYVNSRPLLRRFRRWRDQLDRLDGEMIGPYIAGRFDGDGCLGSGRVPGSRICYTSESDAVRDRELLLRAGLQNVGISHYRKAAEWCLYVHVVDENAFQRLILPNSTKASASAAQLMLR